MQSSAANLLVLVPLLPLLGAIGTVLLGRRLGPRAHLPAVAGIGAAAVVALLLLLGTAAQVGAGHGDPLRPAEPVEMITTLWQWATVGDARSGDLAGGLSAPVAPGAADSGGTFSIPIALRLDPLTATLLTIITGVGLLVAIYSIGYMHDDPG